MQHSSPVHSWRSRTHRLIVTFIGLTLVASVTVMAGTQQRASAQSDLDTTMLLFDLSGSMGAVEPDGRTRLAIAQQAMIDAINGIAPGSRNVGIRSFSGCGVTTLEQAPAPVDAASLAATINSFSSRGSTDIAVALDAIAGDLAGSTGRTSVILLSDGAHNCAGDPCVSAAALIDAGIDVVVHAIGIGTAGTVAESQLGCIAAVTGGTVVSVDGADELFDAIDQVIDGEGATSALIEYQIATCINSAAVQNDPALAASSLGDVYRDNAGVARVLVSGQDCNFDCADGFDMNCDGEIGDFCSSDFDLETVQGVGECLEELGLAVGGEPISEIPMLENNCFLEVGPGDPNVFEPAEIHDACDHYRRALVYQGRADDARSNGDASHGDYNQTLADDAFAKAQTVVDALCDAGPSDGPPLRASGAGWAMDHRISADDGLVLNDVFLGPRKMAEQISLPYLTVQTAGGSEVRIELIDSPLYGDCPDATSKSRLARTRVTGPGAAPRIEAEYRIDQIAGLDGVLTVTQRYEFDPERANGQCEPSAFAPGPDVTKDLRILPCNPFRLAVDYDYAGPGDFVSIEVPQRFHFKVEDRSSNTAEALSDRNSVVSVVIGGLDPIGSSNKFDVEGIVPALANGQQAANGFDNFHQTFRSEVSRPLALPSAPGCPECVHMHWRWGDAVTARDYFGSGGPGSPLIPAGSTQSLRIGVSQFQPGEFDSTGEREPTSYNDVINGQAVGIGGGDPVMWYISSSRNTSDTFFGHEGVGGGFFSQSYVDLDVDVTAGAEVVSADDRRTPVTVRLRNNGPGVAQNVDLSIDVDDGQVFDENLPDGCELASGSVAIVCRWEKFSTTDVSVLRFDVEKLDSTPGTVTVVGRAKSDIVEFASGNDFDTAAITTASLADLQLEGSVSEVSGDRLRYNLTVLNEQTGEARDVVLTVELPSNVDAASVEVSAAEGCSVDSTGSQPTVTCDLLNILPLTNTTVSFWTSADGQSGETAVATVASASPDLDASDNTLELTIE